MAAVGYSGTVVIVKETIQFENSKIFALESFTEKKCVQLLISLFLDTFDHDDAQLSTFYRKTANTT